ncbi:MAG: leucine-rich repeat domain-containing protein [Simkaniaceae bacterium]|nr:leucine-rich repeat domain-containing protein [Simkaniaceae bacterium]
MNITELTNETLFEILKYTDLTATCRVCTKFNQITKNEYFNRLFLNYITKDLNHASKLKISDLLSSCTQDTDSPLYIKMRSLFQKIKANHWNVPMRTLHYKGYNMDRMRIRDFSQAFQEQSNKRTMVTLLNRLYGPTLPYDRFDYRKLTEAAYHVHPLPGIRNAILSRQSIYELPQHIGQFTMLTHLNIDHNRLTSLPDSIMALKALKQLDLGHNLLTDLPVGMTALWHLENINLSHNQFTEIPHELLTMQALSINMSGNPMQVPRALLDDASSSQQLLMERPDISGLESVKTYRSLPESIKMCVHFHIYRLANLAGENTTGDDDWGNTHLIDNFERFEEAVGAALDDTLKENPELRDIVCGAIYQRHTELNGGEQPDRANPDPDWGFNNRHQDLYIYAQAITASLTS